MAAVALLLTLGTMYWCIRLLKHQHSRMDRTLMGLLGMIAMYQGLRILQDTGFWFVPHRIFSALADATIAGLYFIAVMILKISSADRHNTKMQLRFVEANPVPRTAAKLRPLVPERTSLAVFGVDSAGAVDFWHSSAVEFFGWRDNEVLGTRQPFQDPLGQPAAFADAPRTLSLKTKRDEVLEAIVWVMPVPGGASSLVLVLDCQKSQQLPETTGTGNVPALVLSLANPTGPS